MVGAIIVLFNPDRERLSEGLDALLPQVDYAVLVDNSDGDNGSLYSGAGTNVEYIPMMGNKGIAAAQNVGIRRLRAVGMDYALFSDQDSVCRPGQVGSLLEGHRELSRRFDVAAVGPLAVNKRTGARYVDERYVRERGVAGATEYMMMDYVISSFSLIDLHAFERVGLYNEHLFIDAVETTWCFRASYYCGMKSFILPGVVIEHELGKAASVAGRNISISSPFRIYYQLRNLLWECGQEYASRYWRRRNLLNIFPKFVYMMLFMNDKAGYLRGFFRGIRDGLFAKHGTGVPQYDGSQPDLTGNWTFNDWIGWNQVQPAMKYEMGGGNVLEINKLGLYIRLLCFGGKIRGYVAGNDRSDIYDAKNIETDTESLKLCSADERMLVDLFGDRLFVCVDLVREREHYIIKRGGITYYPWNGCGDIPVGHDKVLGGCFMQAYRMTR